MRVKKILTILISLIAALTVGSFIFLRYFVAAQSPCDQSLWRYNAEEEVAIKCVTITGLVVSRHAEDDGDENIQVRPDLQYMPLLGWRNWLGQAGHIAVEPICENSASKKEFEKACAGYISAITLPQVGDRITVTGSYGTDKNHGWREIHPVTNITILSPR